MTLDDSQKQTVRQWIEEGLKVADIQVKLAEEFDITMTYMEVRFLVDDLGVIPKDPEPEVEKEEPAPPPNDAPQPPPAAPVPEENLGELVDDDALEQALKNKAIAQYACDFPSSRWKDFSQVI